MIDIDLVMNADPYFPYVKTYYLPTDWDPDKYRPIFKDVYFNKKVKTYCKDGNKWILINTEVKDY